MTEGAETIAPAPERQEPGARARSGPAWRRLWTWLAAPALSALGAAVMVVLDEERFDLLYRHAFLDAFLSSLAAALFVRSRGFRALPVFVVSATVGSLVWGVVAYSGPLGLVEVDGRFEERRTGLFDHGFLVGWVVACAAAPRGGLRDVDFYWTWNEKFWTAAVVTVGSCFGAVVAVYAVLTAMQGLFGGEAADAAFAWAADAQPVVVWSLGAMALLAVLPEMAQRSLCEDREQILRRAVSAFCAWVLAPVVLLYAALLWAYAARIALDRSLPEGLVGWPVGVFAGGLLLTLLGTWPQRETGPIQVRLLWRTGPYLLIVPLVLLAFALHERIAEYGLTPNRSMAVALAFACAASAAAAMGKRARVVTFAPTALAVVLVAGSVGPWGAKETALRWQTATLRETLSAHGALKDGELDVHAAPARLSLQDWRRWQSALSSFRDLGGRWRTFGSSKAFFSDPEVALRARMEPPSSEPYRRRRWDLQASTWVADEAPAHCAFVALVDFDVARPDDTGEVRIAATPSGLVLTVRNGPPTHFETKDLDKLLIESRGLLEMAILRPSGGDLALSLLLWKVSLDDENPDDSKILRLRAYVLKADR